MTADAVPRRKAGGKVRAVFTLPFVLAIALVAVVTAFVSYVLWPTWPREAPTPDAPAIPIIIAGVLFDVPPAAIREAVQRHPGQQERIDLAFAWPSLDPPGIADQPKPALDPDNAAAAAADSANDRLFVTINALGPVLPPLERLRVIYPRYTEAQAEAGPDGLAVLPFRAGTPYAGEDLVYPATNPEQFFARCSRAARLMPGTCIQERVIETAEITVRFPREWLSDWRNAASSFDRLVAKLHPSAAGGTSTKSKQ